MGDFPGMKPARSVAGNIAAAIAAADDVLQYANLAAFPITGESAVLYIAADTGLLYRWDGAAYATVGGGGGGAGPVAQVDATVGGTVVIGAGTTSLDFTGAYSSTKTIDCVNIADGATVAIHSINDIDTVTLSGTGLTFTGSLTPFFAGQVGTLTRNGNVVHAAEPESVLNKVDSIVEPISLSTGFKRYPSLIATSVHTNRRLKMQDALYEFVVSGIVLTKITGLDAALSEGVGYFGGTMYQHERIAISAVASRTYTASRDTYVDIRNTNHGTYQITYTLVNNGAAAPTLETNAYRIYKVVTNATDITSIENLANRQPTFKTPITVPDAVVAGDAVNKGQLDAASISVNTTLAVPGTYATVGAAVTYYKSKQWVNGAKCTIEIAAGFVCTEQLNFVDVDYRNLSISALGAGITLNAAGYVADAIGLRAFIKATRSVLGEIIGTFTGVNAANSQFLFNDYSETSTGTIAGATATSSGFDNGIVVLGGTHNDHSGNISGTIESVTAFDGGKIIVSSSTLNGQVTATAAGMVFFSDALGARPTLTGLIIVQNGGRVAGSLGTFTQPSGAGSYLIDASSGTVELTVSTLNLVSGSTINLARVADNTGAVSVRVEGVGANTSTGKVHFVDYSLANTPGIVFVSRYPDLTQTFLGGMGEIFYPTHIKALTYADVFADVVLSGLVFPTSANLTSTMTEGVAEVIGTRVFKAATANTFTASRDTYVDLSSTGVLTYLSVANAAAAPAVTANSLRLQKVITDATAITSVVQLASTQLTTVRTLSVPNAIVAGDAINKGQLDAASVQSITIVCSDETTALTAGTGKVTFRMPYAFTLQKVRASLSTAQTSGSIFTVDINEGVSSVLSTKLTIDNTEKTSTTAAIPAVISDTALADDAEITIDIDQIGDGTAKGLKVYLIGVKA